MSLTIRLGLSLSQTLSNPAKAGQVYLCLSLKSDHFSSPLPGLAGHRQPSSEHLRWCPKLSSCCLLSLFHFFQSESAFKTINLSISLLPKILQRLLMAFRMKSKVPRGPQEALHDLHVHLPGLPLPSTILLYVLCSLASESSHSLLSWSGKPPFIQCRPPCFPCGFHSSVLGEVCPPRGLGGPPWALPAEPRPTPVTLNCRAPSSLFPLGTETVLVPFSALSLAPYSAPDM